MQCQNLIPQKVKRFQVCDGYDKELNREDQKLQKVTQY